MSIFTDPNFKKTVYAVEANWFEQQCLYTKWESKVKWESFLSGYGHILGIYNKMPVILSICWAKINNQSVMFYFPTSQVVDYRMIDAFFEQHDIKTAEAANFYEVIYYINQLEKTNV